MVNFKELEGKQVYGIPTGNNARNFGKYSEDEKCGYKVLTITDVKQKYLQVDGRKHTFSPEKGWVNSQGGNCGWLIFESEEAIREHVAVEGFKKEISRTLQYGCSSLNNEQVKAIHTIIFGGGH